MTTIAAIKINGQVSVAADGASNWAGLVSDDMSQKITCWDNGVIVACAGEGRAKNVFSNMGQPPNHPEGAWQAIKLALTNDGFVFSAQGEPGAPNCACSFIFVIKGQIWLVDGAGGMRPAQDGEPVAIGSGRREAIGAMRGALRVDTSLAAWQVVNLAVDVGKAVDVNSGGGTYLVRQYGSGWGVHVHGGWEGAGSLALVNQPALNAKYAAKKYAKSKGIPATGSRDALAEALFGEVRRAYNAGKIGEGEFKDWESALLDWDS